MESVSLGCDTSARRHVSAPAAVPAASPRQRRRDRLLELGERACPGRVYGKPKRVTQRALSATPGAVVLAAGLNKTQGVQSRRPASAPSGRLAPVAPAASAADRIAGRVPDALLADLPVKVPSSTAVRLPRRRPASAPSRSLRSLARGEDAKAAIPTDDDLRCPQPDALRRSSSVPAACAAWHRPTSAPSTGLTRAARHEDVEPALLTTDAQPKVQVHTSVQALRGAVGAKVSAKDFVDLRQSTLGWGHVPATAAHMYFNTSYARDFVKHAHVPPAQRSANQHLLPTMPI